MSGPPWKFEGFITAAENPVFRDWFWYEANEDERNALRDRVNHLSGLKKELWHEPQFKWFGVYGEIRKSVPRGALRVYGFFVEERAAFVFLHGNVKNTRKDTQGMETAEQRLRRLQRGEGRTHEFDFENQPAQENQGESQG